MKFPCIETVVNVMSDEFMLRLWINREEIPEDFVEEEKILNKLRFLKGYTPKMIVEKVQKLVPNLNAIEIRDGGCGVVVYTVDFGADVHG